MPKEYTREQYWELYRKLPEGLKEAAFSAKTIDALWGIYERNEVEKTTEITKYVGQVLFGILPPDELQEILEKELKLKKDKAKKVAQEINRFIFYPVKSSLEELYVGKITPPTKPITKPEEEVTLEEKPKELKKDIYREPVE